MEFFAKMFLDARNRRKMFNNDEKKKDSFRRQEGWMSQIRRGVLRLFAITIILLFLASLRIAYGQQQSANGPSQAGHLPATTSDAASPSASQPAASPTLADFSWLEGRWHGEWGPRVAEQAWTAPKAGTMVGVFRLIESDKVLVIELFTLVQTPEGINYYIRHFTPALVPWEKADATLLNLASADANKFDFENPANGMPKSAILTRLDADTYTAHSELIPADGDKQIIEITYHRQRTTPTPSAGSAAHRKKP
jgi:hypothetical protein